jgi:hypothetical protein
MKEKEGENDGTIPNTPSSESLALDDRFLPRVSDDAPAKIGACQHERACIPNCEQMDRTSSFP